jgi:polysaccharide biosynthesis protein PslF
LTTLSAFSSFTFPVVDDDRSRTPRLAILSTYPPTACGLATFTAALAKALAANGSEVSVVRLSDATPPECPRVIGEMVNDSPASVAECTALLNQSDVAIIQHEYGIYGGVDGDEVIDVIAGLHVPSVVVLHTVLKSPTPHQRSVLEEVVARADLTVVMSDAASRRLRTCFDVDHHKVVTIPHGATIPKNFACLRRDRPTVLTWGLMGPGKGIERVIEAMGSLNDLPGRPRYLVAGRTHPKVLAAEGEAYRHARMEQARRCGVAGSVDFDTGYRSVAMLSELVKSAAVVVLPYDSTDQVTSGVLVDAIAGGRPIVATAFPHAVELLGSGAGIVVDHDDPDALASALRRVLTQPRLAGAMAAEARRLAPEMSWSVVAKAYLERARKLLQQRRARV